MTTTSQAVAGNDLASRMREFSDPHTDWYRSLWGVGSVVAMREVVEATLARWEGTLPNDGALDDFKANAIDVLERDIGVGDFSVRQHIKGVIARTKGRPDNDARSALAELEQFIIRADDRYIWRWSEALEGTTTPLPDLEYTARSVVAHLLDSGLHQEHVLGWLKSRTQGETVDGLLRDASNMLSQGREIYEFAIAFTQVPWEAKRALLKERDFTLEAFREAYDQCENRAGSEPLGENLRLSIRLEFEARDPFSALDQASTWISRFSARAALALGGDKVIFEPKIVDLRSRKIRTIRRNALVKVDAIRRREIYADITNSPLTLQIDDALALLAPQLQSTVGISAAALWGASEGLLGRVDSKGPEVADRLGDIVACAFPRHDVFHLVKSWEKYGDDSLQTKLQAESSNYRKIVMFADYLASEGDPGFRFAEDRLAVKRVIEAVQDPGAYVGRVRQYLRRSFRRLYYQRNLVMHAARFDSVSLAPTARVAPKLVAAGVDQIINARFMATPIDPLGLAARAANELGLLGTPGTKHPATLLS